MKPYNNGTKRMQGKYGMISITPYICSDGDVKILRDKGISLYITKDLIGACKGYLCPVVQNGKIGFINSFAEVVIPPKYDSFIGEFNNVESMIVAYRDNMCGVLNTNGIEMLMGEYQSISLIGAQYAIVMNSEYQKGIIEIMTNQMTVPFGEYDSFNYYNKILTARKKLLKGLITPTGKLITPIQYKWIGKVEYGSLRVIIEEKTDDTVIKRWGLLDTRGNEILPAIYDNILPVRSNGSVVYAIKDNKTIKFDISNLTQRTNIK